MSTDNTMNVLSCPSIDELREAFARNTQRSEDDVVALHDKLSAGALRSAPSATRSLMDHVNEVAPMVPCGCWAESFRIPGLAKVIWYVQVGDSYDATLFFVPCYCGGRFTGYVVRIGCIADYLERTA